MERPAMAAAMDIIGIGGRGIITATRGKGALGLSYA